LSIAHRPILETRDLAWPDEAACRRSAAALASAGPDALGHALIALDGPLGAGKTSFVRHLLRALGVAGRIKSPTFAVLEPHETTLGDGRPLSISHFDFYRFADPHEWESAGFRDVFGTPGLKLVEWSERAAGLMPLPDLTLHIEPLADLAADLAADVAADAGDGPGRDTEGPAAPRALTAVAHTPLGQRLLAALAAPAAA
jgi:tRNA threonylcarbamoyladenosine biosynthesis protein TsaE